MALPWTEIATAWAVFSANILSPGPNVFNTIAIALGSGRRTALAVVPAVALGVFGWSSAALLGAAALFRRVDWAEPVLTLIGGMLLLWLASRYVRRAWNWHPSLAEQVLAPRAAFALTLGILATNPKALTTWLVLISIFPTGSASPQAVAVMIAGSVALAALGHTIYALVFSTRQAARAYARAGRWVNAGVAVFFTTLGLSLIAETVTAGSPESVCPLPASIAFADRPGRAGPEQPDHLIADLDADGREETARPVIRLADGKRGLVVCRADGTRMDLVGLTGRLGRHLDPAYFDRMTYWQVEPAGPVLQGAVEGPPPQVRGDKLLLGIAETSSVLVYWTGDSFTAYWQGD